MNLEQIRKDFVEPGISKLPRKMMSPEAIAMMLAIGMQESRFEHRHQIGGPAHGFWQFEYGGGYKGVLTHHASKQHAEEVMEELKIPEEDGFEAIVFNDVLASAFARLLLWTDAHRLPKLNAPASESWSYYLRVWRPGKPKRESWDAFWLHAVEEAKKC